MNHIKTCNNADFARLLNMGVGAEVMKSKRPFVQGDKYHHQEVNDDGSFTGSEFTAEISSVQTGKHLNKGCYLINWQIVDRRGVIPAPAAVSDLLAIANDMEGYNKEGADELGELGAGDSSTLSTDGQANENTSQPQPSPSTESITPSASTSPGTTPKPTGKGPKGNSKKNNTVDPGDKVSDKATETNSNNEDLF